MQIIQTIHRVNQIATALFEKESTITATQAMVLKALKEAPGVSQIRLVAMASVDRSTLCDVMERLETAGLVRRVRSKQDKRANICELTKDGERALLRATEAAVEAEKALLKQVPAAKSLKIAA